mgnify:CR=1 FL=1
MDDDALALGVIGAMPVIFLSLSRCVVDVGGYIACTDLLGVFLLGAILCRYVYYENADERM